MNHHLTSHAIDFNYLFSLTLLSYSLTYQFLFYIHQINALLYQSATLPLTQSLADLLKRHHDVCSVVADCRKYMKISGSQLGSENNNDAELGEL